jgi:hypothetical protein
MRHETNNEIDLLLRGMGRRHGDSMGDADTTINEGHLDVDELSSYAQNVLPAATRARYTEHLAECSTCRKLVTELSLSLGAAAAAPVETVSAPGGLKAFLAGLFSPMVLRYAVPALGLIVVTVLGFVVLRQQRREEFTAKLERRTIPAAESAPSITFSLPNQDQPQSESKPSGISSGGQRRNASPESKKPADAVSAAPAPVAKDQKSEAEVPPATPTPTAAAPKVATVTEYEAQNRAAAGGQPAPVTQRADQELSKEQANKAGRVDLRPAARSATAGVGAADTAQAKAKPTPAETHGLFTTEGRSAARRRGREDKDETATRSIAGRRFQNERGIWIDTEYDSNTQTVNMARGSEQFRALVADEPAIGTIAKQLDGEVIVVWKGRAYRIR